MNDAADTIVSTASLTRPIDPPGDSTNPAADRSGDATQTPTDPSATATHPATGPIDLDRIEADLAGVEAALSRLADGTYWTDEVTGNTIPDDVLAVNPTIRLAPQG